MYRRKKGREEGKKGGVKEAQATTVSFDGVRGL
jgi:hypothetical protein